jgi:fructose-1,6-bisphosphatase/sedoheptulose 1,7-bisphosphatase-like protein
MPYWLHTVTARNGTQLLDIEICVLDFQRVEGPLDQLETTGERVVTLEKFDAAA